jgi:hypothetical protein
MFCEGVPLSLIAGVKISSIKKSGQDKPAARVAGMKL